MEKFWVSDFDVSEVGCLFFFDIQSPETMSLLRNSLSLNSESVFF